MIELSLKRAAASAFTEGSSTAIQIVRSDQLSPSWRGETNRDLKPLNISEEVAHIIV